MAIEDVDGDQVPPELARLNYVFFRQQDDFDQAVAELVAALNLDVGWVREHTRLGELAGRWAGLSRPSTLVLRGGELEAAEQWLADQPREAPSPSALHRELIASSRRAASRRQRFWLAGALGVAVVSGGLAVWAEVNRQQAVAQRQRVERILERTTEATRDLVVNVANRYVTRRGVPQEMIRDILKQTRRLVVELDSVGESKPELLRNGGLALAELSDALRAQGDRHAAEQTAMATIAVFGRLAASAPDDGAWQNGLVVGYDRLGDIHADLEQWDKAQAAYEKGFAIIQGLAPSNDRKRHSAVARENLGTVKQARGDLAPALTHFRASLGLRLELLKGRADDVAARRDVAVSYEKIGDILLTQGDVEEAAMAYRESLTLSQAVAARDETNTLWQQDLATAHHKLGGALLRQKNVSGALDNFRKDLAIMQRLFETDPDRREWRESLVVSFERLANLLYRTGEGRDALNAYEAALRHAKVIAAANPSQRDWLLRAFKLFQSASLLQLQQKREGDAFATAGEAVKIIRRSADAGVSVDDILPYALNNLGWIALFNRNFEVALESAEEAISAQPDKLLYRPNKAHALMFLGRDQDARAGYLKHAGKQIAGAGAWNETIIADFRALSDRGVTDSLMPLIEKAFADADTL